MNGEILEIQTRKDRFMGRNPLRRLIVEARRRIGRLDPIDRMYLDTYERPQYAYGVFLACMQARMLGQDRVTVIEFGVAGGNGLVALEEAASELGRVLCVTVDVFGVDMGESGMPASSDWRDMVYWYYPGAYRMDVRRLRARLRLAQLVLGDVRKTVDEILHRLRAPIGFCSLDMDYYSATAAALRVLDGLEATRQPRVAIYADDTFGYHDLNIMCKRVGEEAAFSEFNGKDPNRQILLIDGLRHKRPIAALWNEKMYAFHDFNHSEYNRPINPSSAGHATRLARLRS